MKWLIGLAAGAAAVYFLKTDKGRAMMESMQKDAGNLGERLTALAGDFFKKGSSVVADAADKAKTFG